MRTHNSSRSNTAIRRAALPALTAAAITLLLAACGAADNSSTGAPAAVAPTVAAPTATLPAPPTDAPPPTAIATTQPITTGAAATMSETATSTAPAIEAPPAPPQPFDAAATPLRMETVAEGFEMPVFLTHAGDGSGRLFVIEKAGRIRIIADGAVIETPFLDITDRVGSSANEQGLLGLAFAPDYATSGTFFVDYTNRAGNTVISRFTVTDDASRADPASESQVLTIAQPASNHNGGMLLFGPDGMLWVGTGDGGAANDQFGNGQNPQTLLGKMLRLDVTSDPSQPYTIPADNPWVSSQWNGQDVRGEIWALGLRNPWRYSFDKATGDLLIADVGQNTYEEVNDIPAGSPGGLNFGWPIMEGLHCFQQADCDKTGLVLPVIEYDHSGNCAITGGYVYRGADTALQGVYFYGDYCSMRIWAATHAADGTWSSAQVLQAASSITSFGQDEQGDIYVVEADGRIARLVEDK